MKIYHTLWSIYRKMRRQRLQKKWNIYKKVYSMSFDKTILIYALIALGYVGTSIMLSGNVLEQMKKGFALIENIGERNIWLFISIFPVAYIFRSLRSPGIVFSSSEYQLSILPYRLRHIWNVLVFDKWLKRGILGSIIWLVLLLTPLSKLFTSLYVGVFVSVHLAMTVPVWRLYQKRWYVKVGVLLGAGIIVGLLVWLHPIIAASFVVISILIWNVYAYTRVMNHVQWGKVTEISDMHIWKMPFISYITKVPFKREKRFFVLQKLPFRRKRFTYEATSVHHRLWHSYIIKNGKTLFQLLGILLVFLSAMAFIKGFVFYIGVAISIYIFSQMSASMYYDRFKSDILEILPWDLHVFRRTFFRWTIYGGFILLCPVMIYYIFHFSWWVPMYGLLFICVYLYLIQTELIRMSVLLGKETKVFTKESILGAAGLFLIVFSGTYPAVTLIAFFYAFLYKHQQRQSEV
ncbi:MAG TPA: hypothetical protein VK144_01130 [Bacillota bacterium]|nr:hypothetical protein [Bacillota bacterium]